MRTALGTIVGIVVAVACVFVVELIGHSVHPPPADLDLGDPEQMRRLVAALPAAALALVVSGWFVGAFAGAWAGDAVARRGLAGWIVALLVIAAGVYTMVAIPHPAWMWAAGILLPLVGAWLAQRLAKVPF